MGNLLNNKELYDHFLQLEKTTQQVYEEVSQLRKSLAKEMARNADLELENQHLRGRLDELQQDKTDNKNNHKRGLSESRRNLKRLYDEGFHVCPAFYGSKRNNETCMFCDDIIYGNR